ncbi:MAG: hypothetical protein LJE89_09975 [Deltaproteobacteria bacterium]|nr:hypothetical protein [Deltaproteobacteria bacterium]
MSAIFWGCEKPPKFEQAHQGDKGQPPVILDYYAVQSLRPGKTWNTYLRAKDEDGDMKYIAATLHGAGTGYGTSETHLEGEDRAEFAGHLLLETPLDLNFVTSMESLTMEIFIRDWAGNKSKAINLPLTFAEHETSESIPGKLQDAAKHRLGAIDIDIPSSQERGDRK